jgi:hypothetical protein
MVAVCPAKVLVTGANGYLAIWVILEAGCAVRGTVRCATKGAMVLSMKLSRVSRLSRIWHLHFTLDLSILMAGHSLSRFIDPH